MSVAPNEVVLIVEDEEASRETLRELLELEGYTVQTAVNGRDALEQLDALADRVCIILLDLLMPVMDGFQVLEQLRRDGRFAKLKIVVTTSASHRAPSDVVVFQKPLDLDRVLRTVEACC